MKELLLQILTIAYGGVGIVSLIAYWPTMKDLYRKKPSANTVSFLLWTYTSGITLMYSLFILPDLLFIIVSGISFGSCLIVSLLSLRLKNTSTSNRHREK